MQSTAQSGASSTTSRPGPLANFSSSNDEQHEDFSELVSEITSAVSRYCARRPQVAAGCIFSLGFIFGWKLRPW
jgi:hypothetical protein